MCTTHHRFSTNSDSIPAGDTHRCWTKPNSDGEGAGEVGGEGIGYGWCTARRMLACLPFPILFPRGKPLEFTQFQRGPRDPPGSSNSVAVASGSGGSQRSKEASSSDSLGRTRPAMRPQTCPAQVKFAPDPQRSRGALVVAASSFVCQSWATSSGFRHTPLALVT